MGAREIQVKARPVWAAQKKSADNDRFFLNTEEMVHEYDVQCQLENINKMGESFDDQDLGSTVQKEVADENWRQKTPPQADD